MDASPPRRRPRPPSPPPSPPTEPAVSALPREILEKVLSFLPLRDAVRTSAVSRAWRRLWESAPDLALEWGYRERPAAVDAVLARYSRPVRRFRFCLRAASFQRADRWVPRLAAMGVRDLDLAFDLCRDGDLHDLDASIFSCRELTRLGLQRCDIPAAPPGLAGFPKLTKLYLCGVGFLEAGVRGLEALIAESPLLEVLWLNDLWFPEQEEEDDSDFEQDECVIHAPNLRQLTIRTEIEKDFGWRIEELPSIDDVDISLVTYNTNRDFVELLTALVPVRQLSLDMPLGESNALEGLSCSFQNLKGLSLHTDFCMLSTILSTICLLKIAPNLEELSIKIWYANFQEEEVGVDLLNAQWDDGLLGNLKKVTMDLATCQPNEMHFIKFVLSKVRRLQEFHIIVYEDCSRSNEELIVEILKYRRVSSQAKVFFSRMEFI
ncbi:hypothetical protein ACP4OV_018112 [Aristida adscensionis]